MKTGFIGGGNMAEALIKGMTAHGMKDILVSEPTAERGAYLHSTYGVECTEVNADVVRACPIVLLAVKPQVIETVIQDITAAVTPDTTVVSVAAGIPLAYLSSRLNTEKIIRVMPNTPALVQKGMSVLSLCECMPDREIAAVRDIFMSVGEVITLPEKHMNAVTALSGSGPGFIAFFIEAMIEAGSKLGLGDYDARILATQTAMGTARLLETGMAPDRLREMVTSPAGTTEAGLKTFESRGLKEIVTAALQSAKERADELGKGRD